MERLYVGPSFAYTYPIGFAFQGFWMGLLTTSGSLARVVGPIFVAFIYKVNWGSNNKEKTKIKKFRG